MYHVIDWAWSRVQYNNPDLRECPWEALAWMVWIYQVQNELMNSDFHVEDDNSKNSNSFVSNVRN